MSQLSNHIPNVDAAMQKPEDCVQVDQQLVEDITREQCASGTEMTREQRAPGEVFSL